MWRMMPGSSLLWPHLVAHTSWRALNIHTSHNNIVSLPFCSPAHFPFSVAAPAHIPDYPSGVLLLLLLLLSLLLMWFLPLLLSLLLPCLLPLQPGTLVVRSSIQWILQLYPTPHCISYFLWCDCYIVQFFCSCGMLRMTVWLYLKIDSQTVHEASHSNWQFCVSLSTRVFLKPQVPQAWKISQQAYFTDVRDPVFPNWRAPASFCKTWCCTW